VNAAPLDRGGLHYPWGLEGPPPGGLVEVAPGVHWLRMPLPFGLDHINLWVLDGGDHWAIVDTGVALPTVKEHWRALLAGPLAAKPVGRLIVTHYHPDHIGLAGWLATKYRVALEMTRGEFLLARVLTLDVADRTPDAVTDFYRAHGWPADRVQALAVAPWGRFAQGVHRLPVGYRRLMDGDVLSIGPRRWHVVVGSGHSPEHACLWSAADRLLISGDQILPRITSNVSVYPTEPEADPLSDWLRSIERLRRLDASALVLPAHNAPFTGLPERLDALAADHHRKLEALEAYCEEPQAAADCFGVLFRRVGDDEWQMATGEALAHLHWLWRHGRVARRLDGDGVLRFQRAP